MPATRRRGQAASARRGAAPRARAARAAATASAIADERGDHALRGARGAVAAIRRAAGASCGIGTSRSAMLRCAASPEVQAEDAAVAQAGGKATGTVERIRQGAPRRRRPSRAGRGNRHFTHFDGAGQAHMVDVAGKDVTKRVARAGGRIVMRPATLRADPRRVGRERRRARRCADRGDPGGQADVRTHPALPSAAADPGRRRISHRTAKPAPLRSRSPPKRSPRPAWRWKR